MFTSLPLATVLSILLYYRIDAKSNRDTGGKQHKVLPV